MGRAHGQTRQAAAYGGARRRGPYRWTFDRIHEELAEYLGDRTDWPTVDELRDADRQDLVNAVDRAGGAHAWANVMGCTLRPRQDRTPYPEDSARSEAQAIIARYGRLPSAVKVRQLGYSRLSYVIEKAGGAQAFCLEHGLPHHRG